MLNALYIGNPDGGIVSTITQAPQSEEPMVIIGLGGTGVDAITRLKKKLQRQIEPDNKDAVEHKGEEPRYDHIKFLGIDADKKWLDQSGLNQAETLNIQNYDYTVIFSPEKIDALKSQKELQWMSIDYMSRHLPPSPDGAGAYRQFGRWLTISSASSIRQKITQVITQACSGRIGGSLSVHIVSGISGGMGSGSFVDISYITRDVLDGLGFTAAKVFGYFVLPDAIISKDAIGFSPIKADSNKKNGIAALLEIEHLMNLKDSNEWFDQDYGAFQIHTQHKLVDMCHFVSSTNMKGVPVPNGYEYALNVIGDYILAFVSKEKVAAGAQAITMTGNLSNIDSDLSLINPEHGRGYSQNYHIIGSANAEIPTSQMATYLATELFKKLTISRKMPDDFHIEQEFANYLKLSDSHIKQLENMIVKGAGWVQIDEKLVTQYFNEIKAHMNDDILPAIMINPTENSLRQRKGLLIQKRESLEKEVDNYIYQPGASSIPGLALNKLIEIAEDPDKGPIYAYGMMNKTGVDIFHYLDGRKQFFASQRQYAKDQEANFNNQEPIAKKNLGNSNIFNKGSNIKAYTSVLVSAYFWRAQADLYEQMETLMVNLITAFRNINNKYLKPLYDVASQLIETFDTNNTYFQMGKGDKSQDGFTKQLVKFSSIQPELDAEIVKLDPVIETGGLLKILTTNPEVWMEHEELKLKHIISDYVLQKFHPILSGSLESFLRKDLNMETASSSIFTNAIQKNIIDPFVNDAAPIFWTNEQMVHDNTKTAHRAILTVPSAANCICAAANQHKNGSNNQVEVRMSLIHDRIYILRTISGVPMHAYQGLTQYLGAYEGYSELGLHLYEHNTNWRDQLTFPYPYSYVPKYTKNADELLKLYDDAESKGIIYFENGSAYVKQFAEVEAELLEVEGLKENGKMDMQKANERICVLQSILNSQISTLPINSKGNISGNALIKDNFLRFYGISQAVERELQKFDNVNKAIEDIRTSMADSNRLENFRKTFFDSILVGLFEDDGFVMKYKYVQFGMEKTEVLCDNSMPYAGLSKFYQAFKSAVALDGAVSAEITQSANTKFNIMPPKEKKEQVDQLLAMYTPSLLAMISNNYAGKMEQKEIDHFYAAFIQYLNELNVLLLMSGALV